MDLRASRPNQLEMDSRARGPNRVKMNLRQEAQIMWRWTQEQRPELSRDELEDWKLKLHGYGLKSGPCQVVLGVLEDRKPISR